MDSLAAGKLHLSAIVLLGPKLTQDNADELISAAEGKSKAMVEQLIATRFPLPDVQAQIRKLPDPAPSAPLQTVDSQLPLCGNTTATAQVAEAARPVSGGATEPWARLRSRSRQHLPQGGQWCTGSAPYGIGKTLAWPVATRPGGAPPSWCVRPAWFGCILRKGGRPSRAHWGSSSPQA